MENVTLTHANPTVAQTWNHLAINDCRVTVPAAPATPTAPAPDARVAGVETGAGEAVTAWVDASAAERRLVEVAPGTEETHVVEVSGATVCDVVVGEGARARLVVVAGPGQPSGTAAVALRVDAAAGSRVELCEVAAPGPDATFLDSCGVRAGEGATVEVRHFLLDAATSVVGFCCDQVGDASRLELSCRYRAAGGQRLDMNYLDRMRGRETRSDLAFSGVLGEGARKRLADTIDLVHGGKGAKGAESETVLVTGDDVRNQSLPSVLCDEDDVEGSHGATIGSVSPDQLAYMAARGLDEAEAEALFVRATFDDCVARVPEAAEAALAAAARVLGEEAAAEIGADALRKED